MSQHDDLDPIVNLQDWARRTERKVKRQRRFGGVVSKLRYVVAAVTLGALIWASVPLVREVWPRESAAPAPTPSGITATTATRAETTSPFEGTAAATYPVGEKGITLPPARAVTGFSAAQVKADLELVRKAMVAGRLDPDMTVGHRPDDFLLMLAPSARAQIAKWFEGDTFVSLATWIDPAVRLDPKNEPRVSGRVTYRSVVEDGIRTLRITTNFVWVYAFEGEFLSGPLAVRHDQIDWDFPQTRNLRDADRGMWVHNATSYGAWLDCAAADKGLLAPTPKDATGTGLAGTEDQESLAKPDHPLEIGDNCH
ncbi:hypothetical protein [Actinoplanes regularis]|uniref:Uncharacterized protein n=1 Tax=Actinoplanes regularis TaxID=52697 RepID=A0A238Y0B9_9ACTN|nr:hypothetical protein [Actinoplanes regularis]GIE86298.1 hypothetical protein Are01nite_27780 [Actinoplanes regularis]GLW27997.1 hypothetical protein Areg01_09370 [Actinoplanes regularis]SNR64597.1 hypothetical protein SAMN06264365_104155 [Actinoplanes regularis]